jgi:chromosome partitioning protein
VDKVANSPNTPRDRSRINPEKTLNRQKNESQAERARDLPYVEFHPELRSRRPRMIVMANQKGGVGKTTTAINLGTALAAVGERVLIVDLDPQGNASTGLGISQAQRTLSSYHVLVHNEPVEECVLATKIPRLHIIPASFDLAGAEMELHDERRRSYRLRDQLTKFCAEGPICGADKRPISYVLIDCPPSLNLLTINAMSAADAVLVPLQCEFFALEGLSQLIKTVELVRSSLNPRLEIQGVVLTMFDRRNKLSEQVALDVREHLGDKVYKTVIPRNVRVSEAPSYGKPAIVYDFKCAGSRAYLKLASELIQREKQLRAA